VKSLEDLVARLSRLPGIGKKSALRIAYYILRADESYAAGLSAAVARLRSGVRNCPDCGNYTEETPCSICRDPARDAGLLCVVEQPQDVAALEATGEFSGLYHVLMGALSPLDGVGPRELTIGKLMERVRIHGVREVILATNPTVEGDTTALYIIKLLEPMGVKVSRLALGLPVGGDLEYADRLTLARSLRGRTVVGG